MNACRVVVLTGGLDRGSICLHVHILAHMDNTQRHCCGCGSEARLLRWSVYHCTLVCHIHILSDAIEPAAYLGCSSHRSLDLIDNLYFQMSRVLFLLLLPISEGTRVMTSVQSYLR